MSDYRAYVVGSDGHFETFEVIAAPDDERAVEIAEKLSGAGGVEVWQLARRVAVLTPDD